MDNTEIKENVCFNSIFDNTKGHSIRIQKCFLHPHASLNYWKFFRGAEFIIWIEQVDIIFESTKLETITRSFKRSIAA